MAPAEPVDRAAPPAPSSPAAPSTPPVPGPPWRVTVAVPTFRRVALLPPLVEGIERQAQDLPPDFDVRILVLDNDPEASAVLGFTPPQGSVPIEVLLVGAGDIAAVRNAALDATEGDRLLVFVDDDVLPHPGWLDALVRQWQMRRPTAVVGWITPVYAVEPDPWLEAGRFFRRRRFATGQERPVFSGGNLLLDRTEVARLGVRFEEALGAGGGEDTLFSRTLVARGGTALWCDEAVVSDLVPADRLRRAWVLRRTRCQGNAHVRLDLLEATGATARADVRARAVVGGVARILAGTLRQCWGVCRGRLDHQARGARLRARGVGMASAGCGVTFAEYRRARKGLS